jgi:hypothetical protein
MLKQRKIKCHYLYLASPSPSISVPFKAVIPKSPIAQELLAAGLPPWEFPDIHEDKDGVPFRQNFKQ